jgi:hypothetical protein
MAGCQQAGVARRQQAGVAERATGPEVAAIDDGDIGARLLQVVRGVEADGAGADDEDIGLPLGHLRCLWGVEIPSCTNDLEA